MCGIFGVINFKEKHINKPMLHVLGITNDSRGGDSCGLFIDGEVEYGFGKTAKYLDFMYESELLKTKDTARIVLGHCRKASVGGVTLDKAQPTVHRTEGGKIDFVVIHNGTIRNHDELAKKYIPEINTLNWSDSQIMTAIFYKCGYDVLQEYTGGSVFVIADYRNGEPKVMAFQGVSKEYSCDTKVKEERPLFFTRLGDSYVFSSIWLYLQAYAPGDNHQCFMVPSNTLTELSKEGIKTICKYERADKVQNNYVCKNPTTGVITTTTTTITTKNSDENSSLVNTVMSPSNNTITYNCILDKYTIGGNFVHGMRIANSMGVLSSTTDFCTAYYFWEGVILYNKECFEFLTQLMSKKNMTSKQLLENNPDLVHYLGPYPWRNPEERYYDMMINYTYWNNCPFTGKIIRIFDLYEREYKSGKQVGQDLFGGFLKGRDAFKAAHTPNIADIQNIFLK